MDLHLISATGVISIWRTDVFERFGQKPTCGDENAESISYFGCIFLENRLFGEKSFCLTFRPFRVECMFSTKDVATVQLLSCL